MATTSEPERFKEVLTYAILTLTAVFVSFGIYGYYAWGSNLDEAIVTQMLPDDNIDVILIKFAYSINLICSFPIVIYPANQIIEGWFCGCFKDSKGLYWLQNFSRLLVVVTLIIFAVFLADKLDKFLGLIGSLACAPLALTFPALIHLMHMAKTRMDKTLDVILLVISICIFFFCSVQSLMNWNDDAAGH